MRTAFLFFLLFFTSPGLPAQPESAELRAKLDARVTGYSLSASGLANALAKTSKQFQLPMGIEWVRDKDALQGLSRTWKHETVRQILRSIVEAYPGYGVRIENGVVLVFRQGLLNDRHNFLNLKVPDFFEVRRQEGGLTNQRLRREVQNIVSPRNLPPARGWEGRTLQEYRRSRSLSRCGVQPLGRR